MENQQDNRQAHAGRDTQGRWLVGYCPNPGGNTKVSRGRQPWRKSVERLQKQFQTMREMMTLFAVSINAFGGVDIRPADGFGDLHPEDGGIIMNLMLQVFGSDKNRLLAQQQYWDRMEGKAAQTIYTNSMADRINDIPSELKNEDEIARAWEDLLRTNGL